MREHLLSLLPDGRIQVLVTETAISCGVEYFRATVTGTGAAQKYHLFIQETSRAERDQQLAEWLLQHPELKA